MSHQVTHEITIFPWPPPSRAETPAAVGTRTPTPSRGAPAWLHPVNDGETLWENGLISGVFILNNGIIVDLLEVYWDWNEWTGWFHRVFMGISRGFHGCCWISRGLMEANKNWEVAVWGYLLHTYGYPWKMTHLHDQVTLLEKYTWPLPTIYHN